MSSNSYKLDDSVDTLVASQDQSLDAEYAMKHGLDASASDPAAPPSSGTVSAQGPATPVDIQDTADHDVGVVRANGSNRCSPDHPDVSTQDTRGSWGFSPNDNNNNNNNNQYQMEGDGWPNSLFMSKDGIDKPLGWPVCPTCTGKLLAAPAPPPPANKNNGYKLPATTANELEPKPDGWPTNPICTACKAKAKAKAAKATKNTSQDGWPNTLAKEVKEKEVVGAADVEHTEGWPTDGACKGC